MSALPRVVALVPAWRGAEFIRDTLDSLAAQTWPNLEILISDDASPDETADICESYARRDSRFQVIRQPKNLGWIGNVNALLRHARGDYLLFAFQDDPLESTYIEKCVIALEANPAAIIAYSDITLVREGREEQLSYPMLDGSAGRLRRAVRMAGKEGTWWIPNRGVFRAWAADAIGGMRAHLAGEFCADWPWLLHMSLLGDFVRVPERLVTKVFRPRSLSLTWRFDLWPWTAVTMSASAAVLRSDIPWSEKLVLHGALGQFLLTRVYLRVRMLLKRRLRTMRKRLTRGAAARAQEQRAAR